MNNRIICLCVFMTSCSIFTAPPSSITPHTDVPLPTQQIKIDPQGQPVTVNVHIEPNIRPEINMEPKIEPQNIFQPGNQINMSQDSATIAQSKSTATNTTLNQIKLYLSQTIQQIKNISPRALGQSVLHFGALHKKQIMRYTVFTIYLVLCTVLIQGTLFMRKTGTWATWKKDLSMEELLSIPNDQLGKELVHTIQQRHVNKNNPMDHITPLVRFVQAVDYEMQVLNRYLLVATFIQRCRVLLIFPTNHEKIAYAQSLKQRLALVKHTFISWAATDNLANFNH